MLRNEAKWIWINEEPKPEEYARFEGDFSYAGGKAVFSMAAKTDYALYVNGTLCAFGQFAGYPFLQYYDEIDISSLCTLGDNTFSVTVRYEGVNSATHIDDGAGVIFSLEESGVLRAYSSGATACAYDDRYLQHAPRSITPQMGFSSGMQSGEGRTEARAVEQYCTCELRPRPVKKAEWSTPVEALPLPDLHGTYDLGREEAGYLFLTVKADAPANFKIVWGEHLEDGEIRYLIGARNFSLDFHVEEGEHTFFQPFVRLAGRYLGVIAPDTVEVVSIGLLPTRVPMTEKACTLSGLDRRIWDTCVRTLRLCMNAHYEDCPWREQALYALDSRNQMLAGYSVFEETDFARENLVFISKGTREDGFLELTYPAVGTPAIPFFSLCYPVAVAEYVEHTGDTSILADVMGTIRKIMKNFDERVGEDGLIRHFHTPFWNFYEWTEGSDGGTQSDTHLLLNCAYVWACEHYRRLCTLTGEASQQNTERTRAAIEREFFHPETGLFSLTQGGTKYSQLGCAFALLIGLGDERTVEAIKHDATLIGATLSMLTFVYDALLAHDPEAKEYILADIREKYGYMLSRGATSFWETVEGASAFDNAGSLCHGWSAIPIHYYDRLLK